MSPWKCDGATLMKYVDGKWVKAPVQPKVKTAAACRKMKNALYANIIDRKHTKKHK